MLIGMSFLAAPRLPTSPFKLVIWYRGVGYFVLMHCLGLFGNLGGLGCKALVRERRGQLMGFGRGVIALISHGG